jgi:hypothetical protein
MPNMPKEIDLTKPLVSEEVSAFLDWAMDQNVVQGNTIAYFLEKPWKYQAEYNRYRRACAQEEA